MTDHTPSSGSRRRLRPLSLLLFVALVLGSVPVALVVKQVVDDQERRLLDEQAKGAGALLASTFSAQFSTFPLLGDLGVDPAASAHFAAAARPLVASGATVGILRRGPAGFAVERVEGRPAGAALDAPLLSLARRATSVDGFVTDVTPIDAHTRQLLFAARSLSNPDVVTFSEFRLNDAVVSAAADQPFGQLDGVVYIGTRASSDRVVLATTAVPLTRSPVARAEIAVGADRWLVVVTSKQPLVGDLAERLPWIVLAAGVVAALLATALVEIVSRRRSYALRLVDERTTDLQLARQVAEEANRSKSEFLSRMSHELRTPLNAVLGFAQLLESDELPPEQRDSVHQILRGGRHLLGLINEVLDITRIEAGALQLSPEPVLVDEIVDEVMDLSAPLAAGAGITLSGARAETNLTVEADRQRLKQVLLNLVGNAVKYNRIGGSVEVSCASTGAGTVRISVRDTGPGIAATDVPLLFTPFERLGAERTSVEGTGVGLALSRRLAEAMGGTVDLDSAIGRGSTFWVELPAAAHQGGVRVPVVLDTPADGRVRPDSEVQTVLYIEDNLPNLRLVERILADDAGIRLVTATEGTTGLEMAWRHDPALVLLDLHLPDLTGDEVLSRLRGAPQTATTPVVVISADATDGQRERLLSLGATAYLTKPLDVDRLRRLVAELIPGES